MVRSVVKDALFLGQKSELATQEDTAVVDDLLDTLKANSENCVGMAANMIGISKSRNKHFLAGLHRLSSMRLTTVMGLPYNNLC